MREVSDELEKIWVSGDYTGSRRPMVRATLQHPRMRLKNFTLKPTDAISFTTKIFDDQSKWQATPPSVTAGNAGTGTALVSNPVSRYNLKVASTQNLTALTGQDGGSGRSLLSSAVGSTPEGPQQSGPGASGEPQLVDYDPFGGYARVGTEDGDARWSQFMKWPELNAAISRNEAASVENNFSVTMVAAELAHGRYRLWTVAFKQELSGPPGKQVSVYSDNRIRQLDAPLHFRIFRTDGSTEGTYDNYVANPYKVLINQQMGNTKKRGNFTYTFYDLPIPAGSTVESLKDWRWQLLQAGGFGGWVPVKPTYWPDSRTDRLFLTGMAKQGSNVADPGVDTTTQIYADYFFKSDQVPVELPNVKSVTWSRDVDTDVSSAKISMWNTAPLPLGEVPLPEQLDQPGFFTYNRGTASFSAARWKHSRNQWYAQIMPDNIIRTYEGYGFNPRVGPDKDENLYSSGAWIIDDVTMSTDGTLEIAARDFGKILLEQLLTGPIVPNPFEPVGFAATTPVYETIEHYSGGGQIVTHEGTRQVPHTTVPDGGGSGTRRLNKKVLDSSVSAWRVGTNGSGGPGTVKDPWNYKGRSPNMASDDNQGTYWISVGNGSPRAPYAYEWVEWDLFGQDIDQVSLGTIKSGYTAYVSVMIDGRWQGGQTINYHEAGIGRNGSNIPFITSANVVREAETLISFPVQRKVQRVRVTLGNLQNFAANFGTPAYRGAIRETDFRCSSGAVPEVTYVDEKYTYQTVTEPTLISSERRLIVQPAGQNPGKYSDYTDIIILLLAWAGFWYDSASFLRYTDGSRKYLSVPKKWEDVLGFTTGGAVWGDFQMTGTTGKVDLGSDGFHMKPIMDGIQVVKNILLFNFWFDEDGGAQWRQANLTDIGNWYRGRYGEISAGGKSYIGRSDPIRTQKVYSIDEKQVIKTLNATITGKNVREGILTYNPDKKAGYVTAGYNPNPTGLRRLSGWPNTGYDSAEALKMTGELIAQRQLQAYRQDEIVIPGFPALQIDDQVRLVERVTNEGWLHYIKGISSKIDIADGTYEYTLNTHWLGSEPTEQWWMDYNTGAYDKSTAAGTERVIPDPARDSGYWYIPSTKFVSPSTRTPPQTPSRLEYVKIHGGSTTLIGQDHFFNLTVESFTQNPGRWRIQWVRSADATGTRDVSYGPLEVLPMATPVNYADLDHEPLSEDLVMADSGYKAATDYSLRFPVDGNLSEYWWRMVFIYPNSSGPENGTPVEHVPNFKAPDNSLRQNFAMKNESESAAPVITRVVRQTAQSQNAQGTGGVVSRGTRQTKALALALLSADPEAFANSPRLPYTSRAGSETTDTGRTTGGAG